MNIIILILISLLTSCATTPKLRPEYPSMLPVALQDDGSLDKENTDKTVINMLKLQETLDIIW